MDDDDVAPINPETSDSFEIGLKISRDWGIASLVAYQTDIEDFQANDFDASDGTTVTGFTNGGDVETSGFELDVLANLGENLFLSGGVAVSDAESANGGQPIPFAPDLKYSLAAQYEIPLDGGRRVQINGSYVYTDEQLSGNIGQTEATNPEVLLPDYAILNASIGYFSEDDKLGITLIGKNLTDESYATTYSGDGFRYQIPRNADRYFGIDFVLNFN